MKTCKANTHICIKRAYRSTKYLMPPPLRAALPPQPGVLKIHGAHLLVPPNGNAVQLASGLDDCTPKLKECWWKKHDIWLQNPSFESLWGVRFRGSMFFCGVRAHCNFVITTESTPFMKIWEMIFLLISGCFFKCHLTLWWQCMVQLLLLGSHRPFANPPCRSHVVILGYPQIQ